MIRNELRKGVSARSVLWFLDEIGDEKAYLGLTLIVEELRCGLELPIARSIQALYSLRENENKGAINPVGIPNYIYIYIYVDTT